MFIYMERGWEYCAKVMATMQVEYDVYRWSALPECILEALSLGRAFHVMLQIQWEDRDRPLTRGPMKKKMI